MRNAKRLLLGLIIPFLLAAGCIAGCASLNDSARIDDPPRFEMHPINKDNVHTSKPMVALVLSGGSARGFAHIGVIKVLEEIGLTPDLIVGVSAGSMVGVAYASGMSAQQLMDASAKLDATLMTDITMPNLGQPIFRGELGFIRGERLQAFINQLVANRPLQALPQKVAVIATDLQSGKPVAFTQGNTGLAVRASSAVPGVFVPPLILGRLYVDGQVSSPVPVAMARMLGATTVIAVDATFPPEQSDISNTSSVLFQSFTIATQRIKDQELEQATLVIRPNIRASVQLGFEDRACIIAAGEKAARDALFELHKILSMQSSARTR
jgi:NTE family protein